MASSGINPTTVAEAGPIMAAAMNKDWVEDRREVIDQLNRYRLLLYTEYQKFQLFTDVFHCICVATFKDCCSGMCQDSYQGFTLPANIMAPESVWSYGLPMTLRSRWREAHTGLGVNTSAGRVEAVLMPEKFCTERDLKNTTKVKIFAEDERDQGKFVYMEVIDASNRQKKIKFILAGSGFAISPVKINKILSVSLPSDCKGSLLLSQSDNYELSHYYPWETVPSYQRMKIQSSNCPGTVLVQGTGRFQKVYFDSDIVEMGNQLIIEAAAKFFKYGQDTTDANELKRALFDRAEMERLVLGEVARNTGDAKQDGQITAISKRKTTNRRLNGYTRRR